jgi:hypothetical protein
MSPSRLAGSPTHMDTLRALARRQASLSSAKYRSLCALRERAARVPRREGACTVPCRPTVRKSRLAETLGSAIA